MFSIRAGSVDPALFVCAVQQHKREERLRRSSEAWQALRLQSDSFSGSPGFDGTAKIIVPPLQIDTVMLCPEACGDGKPSAIAQMPQNALRPISRIIGLFLRRR